jgi:hypothetical protein
MALHYQTEYRMGTRRIHRSYSGYQAFVAILFDLVFGMLFELVAATLGLALRLVAISFRLTCQLLKCSWRVMVAVMAALVFTVTLPFAIVHRAIAGLSPSVRFWRREGFAESVRKPDWAMGREV